MHQLYNHPLHMHKWHMSVGFPSFSGYAAIHCRRYVAMMFSPTHPGPMILDFLYLKKNLSDGTVRDSPPWWLTLWRLIWVPVVAAFDLLLSLYVLTGYQTSHISCHTLIYAH